MKPKQTITQIAQVKDSNNRLETGVVQCGLDWPGIFIRGDDAMRLALTIETVLESHIKDPDIFTHQLNGWPELLKTCVIGLDEHNGEAPQPE